MTIVEYMNSLENVDQLQRLARIGMCPPHFLTYREIYFKVDLHMRIQKTERTAAVRKVAKEMKKPERTVWSAVQLMESSAA
jgi:hypothetical protein